MTDYDRQKVISGMDACSDHRNCEECPYGEEYDRAVDCMHALIMDMAEMIDELRQQQEPRVMTFDEVKKHYNLPPVFPDDLKMQEDYYQDIQPLYFEFPNPHEWDVHWRGSNKVRTYLDEWEDRYNKTWRCWTARPTEAQREAMKWE